MIKLVKNFEKRLIPNFKFHLNLRDQKHI